MQAGGMQAKMISSHIMIDRKKSVSKQAHHSILRLVYMCGGVKNRPANITVDSTYNLLAYLDYIIVY